MKKATIVSFLLKQMDYQYQKMRRIGLLFALFIVVGCTTRVNNRVIVNDYDAVMSIVEEYINNHRDYDTFLLHDSWRDVYSEDNFPSGYIMGPYYHGLLKQKDNYDSIVFGNSRVYIKIKSSKLKSDRIDEEDKTLTDTSNEGYIVINDAWPKYIHKAIFIYKKDDVWHINNRPDSIFSPQRVDSNIHF